MVDQRLIPAITATIRQNEIGNASPYVLSFARLGKSGASFGFMQGDTNVSSLAQTSLHQVMVGSGVDPTAATRIVHSLSRPLPNGNPLSAGDGDIVNHALLSQAGKAVVDKMDQTLIATVLTGLDSFFATAKAATIAVEPIVALYVAPWINMTGPPSLLNKWVQGTAIHGIPAPVGTVSEADVSAFLQATSYFSAHPLNFKHFHACVVFGAAQLPRPASGAHAKGTAGPA